MVGELLGDPRAVWSRFREFLDSDKTIAAANISYDLAVTAAMDPSLLPTIFKMLGEGRGHDILISQSLDAIYNGTLGIDPRTGGELRSPSKNKVTKRYSLEIVHDLLTGKVDAKANDHWRTSYALLHGTDPSRWPAEARQYPIDDAVNTLEDAGIQIFGRNGDHEWETVPGIPGVCRAKDICRHCEGELTIAWPAGQWGCEKAPRIYHQNQSDLLAQVEAAFAAWLGACHGLRTDPERVERLFHHLEEKNKIYVAHFTKKGWIRDLDSGDPGSEDTVAVKTAIAVAYGASGTCARCGGSGIVPKRVVEDCRGPKVRNRYAGCALSDCLTCRGSGKIEKVSGEKTCKNVLDKDAIARGGKIDDALLERGCDGTGFDLSTAPYMPRSDKTLGIKTDRDTLQESGDDDLSMFGDDLFHKGLSTYYPYVKSGIKFPLSYSPNVIVATGRYSLEGSPLHQMPRRGFERECIRARGAWCGSPIEYVLGSTDYEAGELCCLAQYCYWVLGYSQMRDAINSSGKPGILHSDLAAQVLGISLDEFLVRLKAKDKQAIDFRQASKPVNFGKPGLMGSPKIVITNRKSNAGFTPIEGGPATIFDDDGNAKQGYHGIRFCILISGEKKCGTEKITQWKNYPCAPVCKKCVEAVENVLCAAYNKRYPEVQDYFNWVFKCLKKNDGRVPSLAWDPEADGPRIVRWRGGLGSEKDKSAACNNGFQSMLADVLKHGYVRMTRECYLGVKSDGSPSSLAGCRVPLVIHDEPLSELILETSRLSGPRIADIMTESGRIIAPDVVWKAETALAFFWSKGMEPVYERGELVPWVPATKIKMAA